MTDIYARTAIVAGGTSGIGLASARRLAAAGAEAVVVIGRDEVRGKRAVESIAALGAHAVHVKADLNDPAALEGAVADSLRTLGRIDILVNCLAAPGRLAPFEQMEAGEITALLCQIAIPPIALTRAVLPSMREGGGAIVTVASDAAKVPTPGEAVVGAAMAALAMFTRTVALEVKRHGIRVNAVTPSLVSGTGTAERIAAQPFSAKIFDRITQKASLGVPSADEVADLVAFLAGPGSRRITGQVVSVNGGVSAG